MNNTTKTLMVCLVLAVALVMVTSTAMAQSVWGMLNVPSFTQQPLNVPTMSPTGDFLIDNFEYWDSPYNHGWMQQEPPYPVYGFGMGYATIFNTVLDLQEGSRVLDVYRPPSVFLLSTPYMRHAIQFPCYGCLGIDLEELPILSFKFRAPIGVETWDIFNFTVIFQNGCTITIVPTQGNCQNCPGPYVISDDGNCNFTVQIGREFLDGSWHAVWVNLLDVLATGGDDCDDCGLVCFIMVSGQMFRLDDIIFRAADEFICEPYLFKIGPRYAQFYEPYRYLFVADYRDNCYTDTKANRILNVTDLLLVDEDGLLPGQEGYSGMPAMANLANAFVTDANDIEAYWLNQGADPNFFDPNHSAGSSDTNNGISTQLGRDFVLIPGLPIFGDPNLRIDFGNTSVDNGLQNPAFHPMLPGSSYNQTLMWNATVGGIGAAGVEFEGVVPLEINPFDGMPTYIPVYGPERTAAAVNGYGTPFFGPTVVALLEAALYNAGFTQWPGVAKLDFTPYVFEDIILTIEVTNGRTSDYETFPIEVVNYPVENYPPYIEDVDDQLFPVLQTSVYALSVVDPDNMIFSMANPLSTGTVPATTHVPMIYDGFRTDMSQITWQMTLNGLPSYQYGPWMQSLIDPKTGVVSFYPKFEGAYDSIVVATDPYGASSIANFTIFSVNKGTWLNHPPIIMMDWDRPQVTNAGEEFILTTPEIQVIDPDGDELYFSSNIGSCGRRSNGDFMWTFTTNFPGFYTAEIIAYDIRGGYGIVTIDLEVKPWWSYP